MGKKRKSLENILDSIYQVRYSKETEKKKNEVWKVLCQEFLQKYVDEGDYVLDVAAGHCEFINNIECAKKYALDFDKRIKRYARNDVKIFICSSTNMPRSLEGKIDTVFMGCLLEHLPSKEAVFKTFCEVKKVLKKGGRIIILNPNFRFSYRNYWDYFDHLTPISDRSVVEILRALDFKIEKYLPKFVPNTLKDRLPKSLFLIRLYLKMPFLFPIFGRQMFIVAKKD